MPRKLETPEQREQARDYGRAWYRQNAAAVKLRKETRQHEIQKWFVQYKSILKCIRCGESDIATLDFHHRNSRLKDLSLSQAVHNGWSIERILREIEKCDLLCANCHMRLHALTKK